MIRHRKPKYVQDYIDRHGKHRIYYRRHGRIALPGPLFSPAFWKAYHTAEAGQERRPIGVDRTRAGTFSALIVDYYASTNFAGLRPSTRATYRRVIEGFRAIFGDDLVVELRHEHVRRLIERKATTTPAAANDLLKKIRILCRFAVDRGLRADDPTRLVRRARIRSEGHRTWSEADIEKFRIRHQLGSKERLALELLLNTGQRRSDIVRMGRQHVRDNTISVRQQKTDKRLDIPLHQDLAAAIAATASGQMAFLVGRYGKPYSSGGFGNWFKAACISAGIEVGLRAHGLRKAICRRLAEAGCSASEIMAVGGWRNIREVETYVAAASQKKLAEAAMARLDLSNQQQRLDNSSPKALK